MFSNGGDRRNAHSECWGRRFREQRLRGPEQYALVALPVAWLVDIDGTLSLRGSRDPYDWRRVDEDGPNQPVVLAVQALAAHPITAAIIVISGRHERARQLTSRWLERHDVPYKKLVMRPDDDYRPDDIVKEELFRKEIEPWYTVAGVIDDRAKVVAMWRRLGLVCFQVAEGDF